MGHIIFPLVVLLEEGGLRKKDRTPFDPVYWKSEKHGYHRRRR